MRAKRAGPLGLLAAALLHLGTSGTHAQTSTVLYSISPVDDTASRIEAYDVDPISALTAYLADPSSQTGTQPLYVDLDENGTAEQQGFYDNLQVYLAAHFAAAPPPACPDCDIGAKVAAAGFNCAGGCNPPSNCTPRFVPNITCNNNPPCPPGKDCVPNTPAVKAATYTPANPCECVGDPLVCQKKQGAKMDKIITRGAVCKCQLLVASTPAISEWGIGILVGALLLAGIWMIRRRQRPADALSDQ